MSQADDESTAWSLRLDQAEQRIKSGELASARHLLKGLVASRAMRHHFGRYCNLLRRAGAGATALRLMSKIIYPVNASFSTPATPEERAEYAATLTAVGAVHEALRLLNKTSADDYHFVDLYRAFSRMREWDYRGAARDLESFLGSSQLSPYYRDIAQVNLAACRVHDREPGGPDLLREILARLEGDAERRLLRAHALELLAESAIGTRDFTEARAHLDSAAALVGDWSQRALFSLNKWQLVLELYESGDRDGLAFRMATYQREAFSRGLWEIARDCDLHLSLALDDTKRFEKLWQGTPFVAYREYMLREAAFAGRAPGVVDETVDRYDHDLGTGSLKRQQLDVSTGFNSKSPAGLLKNGQLLQRLLEALSSDFYRPLRTASLHEELFPDRHYNPYSSPKIIFEGLRRLRGWLKEQDLPVRIESTKDGFRLQATAPITLRLPVRAQAASESRAIGPEFDPALYAWLSDLATAGTKIHEISARALAAEIDLPERTVRRRLVRAAEAGWLVRTGAGKGTRFSLEPSSPLARASSARRAA